MKPHVPLEHCLVDEASTTQLAFIGLLSRMHRHMNYNKKLLVHLDILENNLLTFERSFRR